MTVDDQYTSEDIDDTMLLASTLLSSSRSLPNIYDVIPVLVVLLPHRLHHHQTDALTASDIAKPGGFRRHFIQATTTPDDEVIPMQQEEQEESAEREGEHIIITHFGDNTSLKAPLLSDKQEVSPLR